MTHAGLHRLCSCAHTARRVNTHTPRASALPLPKLATVSVQLHDLSLGHGSMLLTMLLYVSVFFVAIFPCHVTPLSIFLPAMQALVWDLALERDPEEEAALAPEGNASLQEALPSQLLFVHAGQSDIKELHWHSQIPGMLATTAADGFNLFRPSNL